MSSSIEVPTSPRRDTVNCVLVCALVVVGALTADRWRPPSRSVDQSSTHPTTAWNSSAVVVASNDSMHLRFGRGRDPSPRSAEAATNRTVAPATTTLTVGVDAATTIAASGLLSAHVASCNASAIQYFATPMHRDECPVYFLLPDVPHEVYEGPLCNALAATPSGRLHNTSSVMNGYHLDYAIVEPLRTHPCRIAAPPADGAWHVDGRRVVVILPLATMSGNASVFFLPRAVEYVRSLAGYATFLQQGLVYAFVPQYRRPPPSLRLLIELPEVSTLTNEVGIWALKYTFSKRKNLIGFFKAPLNISTGCRRHVVIPKVDWHFGTPTHIVANISTKQRLVHCSGRVQTVDRVILSNLALEFPGNVTFFSLPTTLANFETTLSESIFCVDTTGDVLTTRRITTAVMAGCIPVLICDDCVYPFSHLYRYRIARSYDDVVRDVNERSLVDGFDVFYIRLSQYELLHNNSAAVVDVLYRVSRSPRVMAALWQTLASAQGYFLSPLAKGSRFIDAMLRDISVASRDENLQLDNRRLCPC